MRQLYELVEGQGRGPAEMEPLGWGGGCGRNLLPWKPPALFPRKTSSEHYPCPAGHRVGDTQPLPSWEPGTCRRVGRKVIVLLFFFFFLKQKTVIE